MATEKVKFQPANPQHRLICQASILAADQFGVGRIRACKEALELQDVVPYRTTAEQDVFQNAILEWGRSL